MTCRYGLSVAAMAVGLLALAGSAVGQQPADEHFAYVTVVTGGGATHVPSDEPFPARLGRFRPFDSDVNAGEGVETARDGRAIVVVPAYSMVIHLEPDSLLELEDWSTFAGEVPMAFFLRKGEAYVVRRPGADKRLLFGAERGEAQAWTLSKDASMIVSVDAAGQEAAFAVSSGQATYYTGSIPPGLTLDDDGQYTDQVGVLVSAGQRVSTQAPAETIDDALSGARALQGMTRNMYAFGLGHGQELIEDTEQGDFTPVRESAQAPTEEFGGQMPTAYTMSVPRFAVVTTPRSTGTITRVSPVSAARELLSSGVPTESVVGVRFVRSRIIGIPSTTGPLIQVNPFVDIPILLRR